MRLTLLESARRTNPAVFRVGFVSLVVHTTVIVAAVYATLHAARPDDTVRVDTTVVALAPEPQKAPEPPPIALDAPLKGFQTVAVLPQIPTTIPPVNLGEHFDPKDYSGTGVEGGRATGVVPSDNQVYAEAVVEERPALLAGPPPLYPALLREAGIEGRVILRAIVDTTGRADPGSVAIVKSTNPGFDEPARQWIAKALFRPARLHGRAVRVFVNLPLVFSLSSSGDVGLR